MNSIFRGWVWKVLLGPLPGDPGVLNPYLEPHQEISSYDPQNEPNLLRDFAKVGYLELEEALSPNTINPSEITDKARSELENFCLDYGPLLDRDPSSDSIPLYQCRVAAARFAAAWRAWKVLSSEAAFIDWSSLPIEEVGDRFIFFGWALSSPITQLPLPQEIKPAERNTLLLRYWLSMVIWDMWDDVKAPSNVVTITNDGFKPARRYYSLLGVILQRFVDVVQSGAGIKTCGHPLCRREFVASRSNQLHCTDDCTQAHKQKRLRDDLRKSAAG